MSRQERLDELEEAASEYFAKERRRLEAERDFLDTIFQERGSAAQVEEDNADAASGILVDSIKDYLREDFGD